MRFPSPRHRGGIYIAVLGASLLVTVLGVAALSAVLVERVTVEVQADAAAVRYAAEGGIDLALLEMRNNSSWRSDRPHGEWTTDVPIGAARVRVDVTDPVDSTLSNRSSDLAVVRAMASKGQARHYTQVTVQEIGEPIDALRTAIHTPGDFRLGAGAILTVSGGAASTNSTFANNGTVKGRVECLAALPLGTITGTLTLLAPAKPLPADIVTLYSGLATAFSVSGELRELVFSPGRNPRGTTNPDGVYFLNMTGDLRVREIRLLGTFVIRTNGYLLTFEDSSLLQRYRPDYPVLIIDGDAEIKMKSDNFQENGENLNPAGAPYLGATDSDTNDQYPSRIEGLVYATGKLRLLNQTRIKGCVLAASTALASAVEIADAVEIEWDPALAATPPPGFRKNTRMTTVPGSWTQVLAP